MDVVPFFGTAFNVYFPIFVGIFCLATAANLFGRILKFLGGNRFEYRKDYSDDNILEGKMLIRKRKRQLQPRKLQKTKSTDSEMSAMLV